MSESKLRNQVVDCHTQLKQLEAQLAAAQQETRDALASDAQEADEFNAGYQAFTEGLDLDDAEQMYRHVLPADVPIYDVFGIGYAWAKFQAERAALRTGEREG